MAIYDINFSQIFNLDEKLQQFVVKSDHSNEHDIVCTVQQACNFDKKSLYLSFVFISVATGGGQMGAVAPQPRPDLILRSAQIR